MIFDPDLPRPQARTARQSLIRTERGWVVMGQPTKTAETWFRGARDELAALFPHRGEDELNRAGSVMALQLARGGAFR